MNTTSASHGKTASTATVRVWDAPVRVFHWLMVVCFAGAYLSAETESLRLLHVTLGYTMLGLVGFRLVWGFVGTRHARFSAFVRGPRAVWRYVQSLLNGQPEHHTGHNPAGALAIVLILLLTLLITGSGWLVYEDLVGEWVAKLHEVAANVMLLVVMVHIMGVLVSSIVHGENLVRAMLTGRKAAAPSDGISSNRSLIAVLLIAVVLGFWFVQWRSAPKPTATAQATVRSTLGGEAEAASPKA